MNLNLANHKDAQTGSAALAADKKAQGWSLVEMLIAVAMFSTCGVAVASLYSAGMGSLTALTNYCQLAKGSREAMDVVTREVRQAKSVLNYTTAPATLSLLGGDGQTIIYSFNPDSRQLVRDASDGSHRVLLENCSSLTFRLYGKNHTNAAYGVFSPVAASEFRAAKLLDVTWRTSMSAGYRGGVNSDSVESARIVIRKAQTIGQY